MNRKQIYKKLLLISYSDMNDDCKYCRRIMTDINNLIEKFDEGDY